MCLDGPRFSSWSQWYHWYVEEANHLNQHNTKHERMKSLILIINRNSFQCWCWCWNLEENLKTQKENSKETLEGTLAFCCKTPVHPSFHTWVFFSRSLSESCLIMQNHDILILQNHNILSLQNHDIWQIRVANLWNSNPLVFLNISLFNNH